MTPHKHIIALSNEFLTPTQKFMLPTREFIKNEYYPMIATHISNLTAMMSQLMKFCLTIYQYYILLIRSINSMPMGPPPWHLDLVLMSNKTRWVGETWNDTENGAMVTSCVT